MHNMSNLNTFQNSYQILEKNTRLYFLRKKSLKTHNECLHKVFWPKILTIDTLGTNVHKMCECDKNQVPYCNVKKFKK